MKRFTLVVKIFGALLALILVVLFTVPVLFKDKIKVKVEQVINSSVNARVGFNDYSLSFFRHFPNLSFSLTGLTISGVAPFEKDTLASVNSFSLVFDLTSIFGKSGYVVKSIVVDRAKFNAIVLKDGRYNYDIVKETPPSDQAKPSTESAPFKMKLSKVQLKQSHLIYTDYESDFQAELKDIDLVLSGDMTGSQSDLKIAGTSKEFTFLMEGVRYLNKTLLDTKMDLLADFDKWSFEFRDNYLSINGLRLNFSGSVLMPEDDITTDLSFKTVQSSLGSLLSLIPSDYTKDYNDIKTTGRFQISGTAKGTYSDKDSTMPDVSLLIDVADGTVNYPSLPEQISNINILSKIFYDGKITDRSVVNVDKFHFELAGNPFDFTLELKTPVSDPDFKGSMTGKLDLAALSGAIPMDSMKLAGIINISAAMAGRMSMIDKQQYENMKASGNMGISNMQVSMKGYPEVKINRAAFEFTPSFAALNDGSLKVGKNSDFTLNGRISNYIPYIFKNKTIEGKLTSHSSMIDVTEIMAGLASSGTESPDTSSMALIKIPANIDFDFEATSDQFRYGNINGQKAKGHVIVRNGVLSLRETGLDILTGHLVMNADYDTRDTIKPFMKADLDISSIAVKESFNTFNTVKSLAPASRGIDGKVSLKLAFQSLLSKDWMPVINSIGGEGKLRSDQITLLESETFNKVKETLKLGDKYSNTFKDINASFKIANGRIYVSPFDVKTGNLRMNIGGDQGIDQTLNYVVKTEFPRSDLGGSVNALIDNLSSQAAAFGINYKPSEIIKVNLKITGTFTKPVIAPVFGSAGSQPSAEVVPAAKDYAKEKAREEAEKQAALLIKEAEEKAQVIRNEAAKASDAIRSEAETRAKKLVDDSSGKSQLEILAAKKGAETLRKTADKKAAQLTQEADSQANKLIEEARKKGDELIKKI